MWEAVAGKGSAGTLARLRVVNEMNVASVSQIENHHPLRIEDYGLIGDCTTAALVGRNGSIDWLCWPRFDSGALFAALLGTSEHGRWLIAPSEPDIVVSRRYLEGSLVLVTTFQSAGGVVELVD